MRGRLIRAIKKIIVTSDFKTARKKFIDSGIRMAVVDNILYRFKKLRDAHRILKNDEKNIDYWANKNFQLLIDFVEDLEITLSKSKSKKMLRNAPWRIEAPDGAIKVAENDSWVVYKIENYEASEKLGTRNWCISRSSDHYDSETAGMNFYFLLSKKADYSEKGQEQSGHITYKDKWHRIALQVEYDGTKTFWDAEDTAHKNVPNNVLKDMPEFIIEKSDDVVFYLICESYSSDDEKLEAKTLDDAIEEAEDLIREYFKDSYVNRTYEDVYEITVQGREVHNGSVKIEGLWAKLRKELEKDGEMVCSDNARHSRAYIMKKNDEYYFSTSDFSDTYCEEIDENTLFFYRLVWGDIDAIEWSIDESLYIILYNTNFYKFDYDESLYFDFLHALDLELKKADEIQKFVKRINEDSALTLLYRKGHIESAAYNPENNEMVLKLSESYDCYKCEYKGNPEKYPDIEFIDMITEEQYDEISSQDGWIKV